MAPTPIRTERSGCPRDATLDEVRRAYRRLAKANHPDAAGEAALPRFLAIQAAYDTIAGPDARAGRRPGAARPAAPETALGRRPRPDGRDVPSVRRPVAAGAADRCAGRRAGRSGGAAGSGLAGDRPPGTRPAAPSRAATEQGDARLDVVRRRGRRAVRARLGRRFVVRDDVRHVLDAEPEGVRRSAQARTGVPGTGPPGAGWPGPDADGAATMPCRGPPTDGRVRSRCGAASRAEPDDRPCRRDAASRPRTRPRRGGRRRPAIHPDRRRRRTAADRGDAGARPAERPPRAAPPGDTPARPRRRDQRLRPPA